MNRIILPYISMIVMLIFAVTSVLQFHHHDCDGNIYIHLTTFDDFVISQNDQFIEKCDHNHESEHEEGNENQCSMHLGDYKASETDVEIDNSPLLLSWLPPTEQSILHFPCAISMQIIAKEEINTIVPFSSVALRAPPIV